MEGYEIVRRSAINGEFTGFGDGILFRFVDGTTWVQAQYKYWYHYAYRPKATILRKDGLRYIQVDEKSEVVPVRQVHDVIESKISGEFKGWEGDTQYELINGQIWKQVEYKYEYKYAYRPEICIYDAGSGHVMQVEGTFAKVRRVR